jgi:two-component system sensor histidine kinase and response regulator WspE
VSNLSAFSMWDLFRGEVESQMRVFTDGLLAVESGGASKEQLAAIMRAAHSIKGAARIVQLEAAVQLAHSMEDCLVAVQEGSLTLGPSSVDILLSSGDFLAQLSTLEEAAVPAWVEQESSAIALLLSQLADVRTGKTDIPAGPVAHPVSTETGSPSISSGSGTSVGLPDNSPVATAPPDAAAAAITKSAVLAATVAPPPPNAPGRGTRTGGDRAIRITAQTLNRLMGLAGESLVQSRWFEPFYESLLGLKKRHMEINELIESLQPHVRHSPEATATLATVKQKLQETRRWSAERRAQLDVFGVRAASLSDRLYREVVASRMRPFGDGVEGFPRMVRDLSRQLGKQAQLEILGANTEVDREILDRLEAPLNHAIRNSVDHGIERPEERIAAGKPPVGTIVLEARHRAGLFVLVISDDGRGVEIEALRRAVIAKGLASSDMAANFSEAELLEFLFLPGFSTAHTVTDISGRGVGLDAVQEMAKSVGGMVSISTRSGKGLSIQLELPLTLSVLRTFVAEICGEPFAFPLARVERVIEVNRSDLSTLEGQQYFSIDGERVGVVAALEVFDIPAKPNWEETVPVVLLGDRSARYGLAVDKFVGEYEMVVRPLDARLGKVPSISAAALMEDGSPILIVDVDDLTRSIQTLLQGGRLHGLGQREVTQASHKRILVVDDSVTVRELQRSLLRNRGYLVEVAVDGMDGWNALRTGGYELIITDVDMPRMTGIELVSKIKADSKLQSLPVIIVSYKDREEDRMRGLDAGADRYLTKSSFHDETLLTAVSELIGLPDK